MKKLTLIIFIAAIFSLVLLVGCGNGAEGVIADPVVDSGPEDTGDAVTTPDEVEVGENGTDEEPAEPLEEFVIEDGVLVAYNGADSVVVVPDGVVRIGRGAFRDNTAITEVVLPSTILEIGASAFSGCEALQTINLPEGIITIGIGAFNNCRSLNNVILPNSVIEIRAEAFRNNISLREFVFTENVVSITYTAFRGAVSLPEETRQQILEINPDAVFE